MTKTAVEMASTMYIFLLIFGKWNAELPVNDTNLDNPPRNPSSDQTQSVLSELKSCSAEEYSRKSDDGVPTVSSHTLRFMHKYCSLVWHIARKGYIFMDSPMPLEDVKLSRRPLYGQGVV